MKPPENFSRRDVVLLILLAGLVALFFWRILTPNPTDRAQFPPGDFTDQFYAFRLYEARAFAQGRLPLWSESYNSGHPFFADIQSAVLYPIGLANTLLNAALFGGHFSLFALELEALLHFYLAGAFTYLFARRLLMRAGGAGTPARVGAFVAALVFTFGGYLTSYPSLQLAILETAVWLPLALYFLDRAIVGGGLKPAPTIAAGVVLGMAALAGHPQTLLFVVATCALYFAFRVWTIVGAGLKPAPTRVILNYGIVLVIAFGIAAVQWIPSIEYQQLSTREALSFADAAKGFPTLDLLQFILPGFASAFASPLFVGILPLWLAMYALLKRERERAFWGLLALGALLLSFGFYVFAYVLFYLFVPGAALFRQQERLAFIISFALAILAGYGIRDLVAVGSNALARRLYIVLPVGAVIAFALLITFFSAATQNAEGRIVFLGDRAGLMLVIFGVVSLGTGLYLYNILPPRWFVPVAIILVLFDLWSVNETANKGRLEERFAENPLVEVIKQDRATFRVATDEKLLPGHFGIAYGLEETGGISPLRLARYDALLHLPRPIVDSLLNVKYAITTEPQTFEGNVVRQDGNARLVQLIPPRAPAWLVGNVIVADDAQALATMQRSDFDPMQQAVLAALAPFPINPQAQAGQVTLVSRRAEDLTLDAYVPADGLLVVSENFYPGWRATVDGIPTDILRADINLRAIPLRAGQHRVEMVYDPWSFKLGAVISALTIVGCVILAVLKIKD